jgi:uncharacterized protein
MTTLAASPITLSALCIYPVKSCRGVALRAAQLDAWGLQFDRNWMVVNAAGRFLSQRELPQMALIETAIRTDSLHLSAPGAPSLAVPLAPYLGETLTVQIWRDQAQAIDQGEVAAAWFSQVLGQSVRLVRIGTGYSRPVKPALTGSSSAVSFADGYPLLLISEASLADLNARLPETLPMNRFRPNLVISGCEAYAEDSWQQIQINGIAFSLVSPCERCAITTTDQATGSRTSPEPLKTLATYRHRSGGVIFGQNLVHQSQGEVMAGSLVQVIR